MPAERIIPCDFGATQWAFNLTPVWQAMFFHVVMKGAWIQVSLACENIEKIFKSLAAPVRLFKIMLSLLVITTDVAFKLLSSSSSNLSSKSSCSVWSPLSLWTCKSLNKIFLWILLIKEKNSVTHLLRNCWRNVMNINRPIFLDRSGGTWTGNCGVLPTSQFDLRVARNRSCQSEHVLNDRVKFVPYIWTLLADFIFVCRPFLTELLWKLEKLSFLLLDFW